MSGRPGRYDRTPTIPMPAGTRLESASGVWAALARASAGRAAPLVVIDAYPGVDVTELAAAAAAGLPGYAVVDVEQAAAPAAVIADAIEAYLTADRVFGVMGRVPLEDFYDADAARALGASVAARGGPTVVIGWGAALIAPDADVLVLADLPRWEIQQRQRAGAPNWHAGNEDEDRLRKFKRGYFVEWRTADAHKRGLFERLDFVLDTTRGAAAATMIDGDAFRAALEAAGRAPFRLVPFFDPGVWGGQWMRDRFDLDPAESNYAWCFDCVPEENSLLLAPPGSAEGDPRLEIPAMDLVLLHPRALLGDLTHARFGAEFPIRFDLLDTMGGQNLSLQVHPLTDYIQREFGMHYTQDESYYLLDAAPGAVVHLGLKEDADPDRMAADLREAAGGGRPFPAEEYVDRFPAAKHDHFSIPAGTVHCSGAGSMVLEISATPYIFTFKLWDWGRVGLDGLPRPVHLDHGLANIQWDRRTAWVRQNLVDRVEVVEETPTVREERTGLHELEFIDVRRHWFTGDSARDTSGTVHVLNLVDGDEVEVVSSTGSFPPFTVHYAETFVVPAAVGRYVIRPTADARSGRWATITASVRGTAMRDGLEDRLAEHDLASMPLPDLHLAAAHDRSSTHD